MAACLSPFPTARALRWWNGRVHHKLRRSTSGGTDETPVVAFLAAGDSSVRRVATTTSCWRTATTTSTGAAVLVPRLPRLEQCRPGSGRKRGRPVGGQCVSGGSPGHRPSYRLHRHLGLLSLQRAAVGAAGPCRSRDARAGRRAVRRYGGDGARGKRPSRTNARRRARAPKPAGGDCRGGSTTDVDAVALGETNKGAGGALTCFPGS